MKTKRTLIYKSREITALIDMALKAAKQDVTVLILGESGTGKEVIADFIYQNSLRHDKPFVKINCGALPEKLLESELFGYEKGAFTGANTNGKVGFFQLASGGTLFLDEIGTLPLHLQTKLLRAIQEKEILPIGRGSYISVDVRLIAATNIDLSKAVALGDFRQDLYYRLNVVPLFIPPLRDRKDDLRQLTYHFLQMFNKKYLTKKEIDSDAWDLLLKYQWPGNVRELENLVERLVVMHSCDSIGGREVSKYLTGLDVEDSFENIGFLSLKQMVDEYEKRLIQSQLPYHRRSHDLANTLKIDKSTLTRKMKKYHIKNPYIE